MSSSLSISDRTFRQAYLPVTQVSGELQMYYTFTTAPLLLALEISARADCCAARCTRYPMYETPKATEMIGDNDIYSILPGFAKPAHLSQERPHYNSVQNQNLIYRQALDHEKSNASDSTIGLIG